MKKTLFLLMACLMGVGHAVADDVLTVGNVTLPQNGEAVIEIGCQFDTQFKGYQLDVELDGGLTLVLDEDGKPLGENGFTGTDHTISSSQPSEGKFRFVVVSMSGKLLPTNGTLLKVRVTGADEKSVGETFSGRITATEFTTVDKDIRNLDDVNFTITIGEPVDPWTTLDETSTTVPEASDGEVDIKVKRTIYANEWSTICLPFDMTEEQVKEAFGDDVQLAEFTDYEAEYDADDKVTSLAVNFKAVDLSEGFYANYPYLIKTSKDIKEFTATSTIEPDEEGAVAEYDNGKKGKQREVYGSFIGTYHTGTVVPSGGLVLSGNKFWYSAGQTKMMAFRAYFTFDDVLASMDASAARIYVDMGSETTGINSVSNGRSGMDDGVYDLAGRRVPLQSKPSGLKPGLYIKGGKKS